MKSLFLLLITFLSYNLYSQNGAIVGTIKDADNRIPLPGANIILDGTDYGTVSDIKGNFIIPNVISNDYILKVSYIGYNDFEIEVNVSSTNLEVNIELESGVLVGDEIIITGNSLQGQARAINEQKNNVNVTNIISSDQAGKFPDSNMGDALKRVPGITMQGDMGEARNIVVRGLASALNSVQIDGSITSKPIYNGSFVLGNRLGNFGFLLSGSYNNRDYGSDNIEAEWREVDGIRYMKEMDIRTYYVKRERKSLSLNLDYEFSASSKIYFNSLYNHRDDWENRFRLRFKNMDDTMGEGDYTSLGDNTYQMEARVERQTKGGIDDKRNKATRLEDQKALNMTLGGDHLVSSKLKIDWMVNYSRASEERPNERYLTFRNDPVSIKMDLSDTRKPFISYADPNVISQSKVRDPEQAQKWTYENEANAKVDFTLPVSTSGILKFGLKNRGKSKKRNNTWSEFEGSMAGDVLSQFPLEDQSDPNYLAGGKYLAGNFVTREYLGGLDLLGSNFESSLVLDEFAAGNYEANENIFAAYLMYDVALTSDLSLIIGGRLEATNISYTGRNVDYDNETVTVTDEVEDNYSNFLPAVLFKYNLSENSALRFSWTNTIARPNYYDLVPYQEYVEEDDELSLGNSLLDPMRALNLDLNFESYFSNIGLVSAGLFYKNLNDFIYNTEFEGTYTGYTGELTITQPQNGANASVFGFELALQRQILKNLGLYLNYTYADTDTEGVLDRSDLDKIPLPGAAKNTFNASLDYETDKFNVRVSYNYTDGYIDEFGSKPTRDRYYDSQGFLDINASVSLSKNLILYAEAKNLTNQALRYYQGEEQYVMQEEFYGSRYTAGIKFDLFK